MFTASVPSDVFSTLIENIPVINAGNYLDKTSGERIEYECRNHLSMGYKSLVISFRNTKIVNSIGISILIGIIEAAKETNSKVIFAEANEQTVSLFEMLGLTKHVAIVRTEKEALCRVTSLD
jgi:anti-anti-sigma regulatory factor